MDTNGAKPFRPPSMAFATFWNFIADLSTRALPPQIDRSVMHSKSGSDQNSLIAALAGFGLIDDEQRVLPPLQALTAGDDDQRRAELSELVRTYYAAAMEVSDGHGTHQQLNDEFRDTFGLNGSADTRRKAMTFFLHAARTAGLTLSDNFPSTRSGSGGPGTPRARRTPRRKPPQNLPGTGGTATTTPPLLGDTYTVTLRSGGNVSLAVAVNLFDLSADDRGFIIDLVDKVKGYREADMHKPHEDSAVSTPRSSAATATV